VVKHWLYEGMLVGALILPVAAHAACNAGADPCAPKKELGAWDKSIALGFNYTSGNSDTTIITGLGNLSRETTDDTILANISYGYGEDRSRSAVGEGKTNRNDFRGAASYKYNISETFYGGFGGAYLHDQVADVSYRVTLNPTLGAYLVRNDDIKLGLEAGPSYLFEKVGGEDDNYLAPRIADRFDWILTCTSKLYQSTEVLFDTSESKNTLINSEVGIEAALSSSLSLVLLVRDTFDNLPAADREKNDIAMITALKVAL